MMPSPTLNRIKILKQSFQIRGKTLEKRSLYPVTLNGGWAGTQARKTAFVS